MNYTPRSVIKILNVLAIFKYQSIYQLPHILFFMEKGGINYNTLGIVFIFFLLSNVFVINWLALGVPVGKEIGFFIWLFVGVTIGIIAFFIEDGYKYSIIETVVFFVSIGFYLGLIIWLSSDTDLASALPNNNESNILGVAFLTFLYASLMALPTIIGILISYAVIYFLKGE